MPLYDYDCGACGPFRDWAAMADYAEPQPCPQCSGLAARSVSAPHCRTGGGAQRYKAEAFNERSANEPKTVSHVGGFGKHGNRDGHRHHDHARSTLKKNNRPWMIGH
ncbi:MAG: zinc ribbon domain-containing protein [Rhodospirillales bacterium]|nr:zinc ribbon domain-containing protein [Rhodospirillales bacterium]